MSAAWSERQITIDCALGPKSVAAWLSTKAPGLAVHEYNGWTVTHLESGLAAIKALPSKQAAQAAALELSAGGDFSVSVADLKKTRGLRSLANRVSKKFGGIPCTKTGRAARRRAGV
jgi:hypothetical protein